MIFISVFDHWQENTPVMSLQLELNRENCAACFTVWNSVNAANPSPAHLLWMSPDIFFIHLQKYFKSLVLFTAGGSHGPQQFSGENILLHTEVWLCSMSRELSVWLYFRTYLQTTMKGLFCLMHIFPLERHVKRFRDCPEDSTNLFFTFHIVCSHTVDHRSTVCKPCKLKPSGFFFHTLLERKQITSAHDYSHQQIHIIYSQILTLLSTRNWRSHTVKDPRRRDLSPQ